MADRKERRGASFDRIRMSGGRARVEVAGRGQQAAGSR